MDSEKVIKGLRDIDGFIAGRVGFEQAKNFMRTIDEAVALLKEQEAVKPKSKVRHGANAQIQHFCGNCNSMLHGKPKYCSECGKGVLW